MERYDSVSDYLVALHKKRNAEMKPLKIRKERRLKRMNNIFNIYDSLATEEDNTHEGFKIIPIDIKNLDKTSLLYDTADHIIKECLKERYNHIILIELADNINSIVDIKQKVDEVMESILTMYIRNPLCTIINLVPLDIYLNHSGENEANYALEFFTGLQFMDFQDSSKNVLSDYVMIYMNDNGGVAWKGIKGINNYC